jgi:hypothetical protein
MTKGTFSRRMWLRGAAGATLSIPFLPSLARQAAADPSPERRFVCFFSRNGQFKSEWFPSVTAPNRIQENVHHLPLREIDGPISHVVGPHFDGLRDKLTFLMGLDGLSGGDHNYCFPLTASSHTAGGSDKSSTPFWPYSVDAVLERSDKFYPSRPALGALRLSPDRRSNNRSMSWFKEDGVARNLPTQWSSASVFQSLFDDSGPDAEEMRRTRRQLVIDRVKDDYDRLNRNPRLGSEDRRRLSNYVDHLRDIETHLANAPSISCSGPGLRVEPTGRFEDGQEIVYQNHFDILVAALACGVTKIGTVFCSHPQTDGEEGGFHGNSHGTDDAAARQSVAFNEFIGRRFVELCEKMDAFTETDGTTLLDNSIVLWGQEISNGNGHNNFDMPVLVAGSGGGRLRTGELIDYRARPQRTWTRGSYYHLGRPYNQLLTTFMTALGLGPEDWELEGTPGFGDYQLMGHRYAFGPDGRGTAWQEYEGQERQLLPYYLV